MATQPNVRNNWLWKYFTKQDRFRKCNICKAICSEIFAPAHLYRSHKITDQSVILKWNNDNHLIWQHFSKKDLFIAECKICGRLLKSAYDKRILDAHLRIFHSQEIAAIREEITRTWVSSHFTFDHKYEINCKHCCDYSFKIYDGVDVLKNHLKENHNIDEYFENRIEDHNIDEYFENRIEDHNIDEYLENRVEEEPEDSETTMQFTTEEIEVPFSQW